MNALKRLFCALFGHALPADYTYLRGYLCLRCKQPLDLFPGYVWPGRDSRTDTAAEKEK